MAQGHTVLFCESGLGGNRRRRAFGDLTGRLHQRLVSRSRRESLRTPPWQSESAHEGRDRGPIDRRRSQCSDAPGASANGVGRESALARPARAGDHVRDDGVGHHRGLSPSVHPPQLRDDPRAAGSVRGDGLNGRRGPCHRVGLHAPQAPSLLRPPRATGSAGTSPTPAPGSSAHSSAAGWPGRSCASPPTTSEQ